MAIFGDKKKEMVDENPIYAGRPLRPDGTCDQLNRSWEGVPLAIRQIIHIAINDTRELMVSHTAAHDLLDPLTIAQPELDGLSLSRSGDARGACRARSAPRRAQQNSKGL